MIVLYAVCYLVVGLLCGRIVNKRYHPSSQVDRVWGILCTPLVWPLVAIVYLLLVDELPTPIKGKERRFQEKLAADPFFRSAYENLVKEAGFS